MRGFERQGIDRVIVLPMFPQFSSTTTAPIFDALVRAAAGRQPRWSTQLKRSLPSLRFIAPYYDHRAYIAAMRSHLESQIASLAQQPDIFIISFHGIPARYVQSGDPYRAQCERTAGTCWRRPWAGMRKTGACPSNRALGPNNGWRPIPKMSCMSCRARAYRGHWYSRPGFLTDCLETLDELGNEGCEQFAEGGGDPASFRLAPCLNASPQFMDALAAITRENAGGWVD